LSFVAKLIRAKALVYDLRFPMGDFTVWYILEIEHPKHAAFLELCKRPDPIDFRDYGTILYSGFGEPSKELMAELQEKYGMYENES